MAFLPLWRSDPPGDLNNERHLPLNQQEEIPRHFLSFYRDSPGFRRIYSLVREKGEKKEYPLMSNDSEVMVPRNISASG
ncbi:hypothetical protein TNCV_4209431 [Trichonephila clavipes]|nr:hypothetical protein TNCV_4209431 [Trichonephila clavipes]